MDTCLADRRTVAVSWCSGRGELGQADATPANERAQREDKTYVKLTGHLGYNRIPRRCVECTRATERAGLTLALTSLKENRKEEKWQASLKASATGGDRKHPSMQATCTTNEYLNYLFVTSSKLRNRKARRTLRHSLQMQYTPR